MEENKLMSNCDEIKDRNIYINEMFKKLIVILIKNKINISNKNI